MADDESSGSARPGSRGPRVVTGDMVGKTKGARVVTGAGVSPPPVDPPPPADDVAPAEDEAAVAETLVAPAAPAPIAYEPRRPRVVTGRTTLSVGARAAQIAADTAPADAGPADGGPIEDALREMTQTVPGSVHRDPAPPPTSKPPKASKPPRTPSAGGSGEGLGALVLALLSLVLFAVPAIPALILARRARRRAENNPNASGAGLAGAARVVAVFSLLAWLIVAGVVLANVAKPDGVDYAKLKAGDCIDTPEGTEVRRLTVRPCTEAHDAEVFAVVIHPAAKGDAFPGADALLAYAADACLGDPFTAYVGVPRGQSQLTEFEIVPEAEAWSQGRRGLVCAVDAADRAPMTASVKGTAK